MKVSIEKEIKSLSELEDIDFTRGSLSFTLPFVNVTGDTVDRQEKIKAEYLALHISGRLYLLL